MAQEMDRDTFLKLLITELRNQDPMSPMDDKDFIAQLAQFSSLEQMQRMNGSLEVYLQTQYAFGAAALIGRTASATDPLTGEMLTGRVESVSFESGTPLLRIQGRDIPLGFLISLSQ